MDSDQSGRCWQGGRGDYLRVKCGLVSQFFCNRQSYRNYGDICCSQNLQVFFAANRDNNGGNGAVVKYISSTEAVNECQYNIELNSPADGSLASGNNLDVYPFYSLRQKTCHHELSSDSGTIACLKVDYRKTWLTASERYNRDRNARRWEIRQCYDEMQINTYNEDGSITEFDGEGNGICGRRYFRNQWLFCSATNRLDVDLVLDNRTHRRERWNVKVVSFSDASTACRQRGLSTDSKEVLGC